MLNTLKRLGRGESLKIAVRSGVGEADTGTWGAGIAQNLEIPHLDFYL